MRLIEFQDLVHSCAEIDDGGTAHAWCGSTIPKVAANAGGPEGEAVSVGEFYDCLHVGGGRGTEN